MSTLHYQEIAIFVGFILAFFLFVWFIDVILGFGESDYLDANEVESEQHFAEEISDPYERIEAQDAEIQRLYSIIETLKEDIYLLRNIRHSEPTNAGSELRGNSTEGLTHSTALPDSGLDCA
jgi:hypothetical protein